MLYSHHGTPMYEVFLSQNHIFCNLEESFVVFMEKNALCHSPGSHAAPVQAPRNLAASLWGWALPRGATKVSSAFTGTWEPPRNCLQCHRVLGCAQVPASRQLCLWSLAGRGIAQAEDWRACASTSGIKLLFLVFFYFCSLALYKLYSGQNYSGCVYVLTSICGLGGFGNEFISQKPFSEVWWRLVMVYRSDVQKVYFFPFKCRVQVVKGPKKGMQFRMVHDPQVWKHFCVIHECIFFNVNTSVN